MTEVISKSMVLRTGSGETHELLRSVCRDTSRVKWFAIEDKFFASNWYTEYQIIFRDGFRLEANQ